MKNVVRGFLGGHPNYSNAIKGAISMDIYPSYTYHISWTEQNKHYYGVRMANQCQPEDDLWTTYHTSSNIVKSFREEYGEPDIIRIDETFDTRKEAADYEHTFLVENDCVYSDEWLNAAAFPLFDRRGTTHTEETKQMIGQKNKGRGKGKKQSPEHIMKRAAARRGSKHSEEARRKMSEANKGENNPRYGKTLSKETKRKLSEALTGRKRPIKEIECPHCNLIGDTPVMKRWHFDNCKKNPLNQ